MFSHVIYKRPVKCNVLGIIKRDTDEVKIRERRLNFLLYRQLANNFRLVCQQINNLMLQCSISKNKNVDNSVKETCAITQVTYETNHIS